jgi:acetoin utilization protein AcuC
MPEPAMEAALVWDPSFTFYRFRPDHPFNPKRLELTVSLIEALELVGTEAYPIVEPRHASDDELQLAHAPEYVDAVRRLGTGAGNPREAMRWGLGTEDTPVFPEMHEITSYVVGGTLRAAELVMSGQTKRAFNIAGGLHHAHRDRASGFCVYDDLAVAIAWMRREHDARVLYIDYDAHHGDGVQGIFYGDPDVLTLSIHESGRYLFPGTGMVEELGEGEGYGYSLNLPLEPFTEDGSWLDLHRKIIPEVVEAFRPDVIVLQNGCDGHVLDPLTHLRATTRLYEETVRIVVEAAEAVCGGRIVATGGGGYAVWRVVPRAWTLVWGVLSGQTVPDAIPRAWAERWQGESPDLLPDRLRDPVGEYATVPRGPEITAVNRSTLEELRRQALPLIRGWGMGF